MKPPKDLTKMSFAELHQYKSEVYARKPLEQREWTEIDRINEELKSQDKQKKKLTEQPEKE